jgi:ribosome-binding factor A
MKQSQRSRRIADLIVRELGAIFLSSPLEPSAGFVTITGCEVSVDLRFARVFYSVLGGAESWPRAAQALEKVRGRLRGEIAHRLDMRHTPELIFTPDHSLEEGDKIERLLREAGPIPPKAPEGDGETEG